MTNYYPNIVSPTVTSRETAIISRHDLILVITLAFIGLTMNKLPYSNTLSLLLQAGLIAIILFLNMKRPVIMIISYIFLNIMPARLIGGFSENVVSYFTLNARNCIVLAILFWISCYAYRKSEHQRKYNLWLVCFSLFAALTFVWTASSQYYYQLWWICVAYVLFPYFINTEEDLKLILFSYFTYVQIFCISIFPKLVGENLYRGIIVLDPNFASFTIILSVVAALIMLARYKNELSKLIRLGLIAGMLFDVAMMSFFASRTAFICLAILLLIFMFINIAKIRVIVFTVVISITSYIALDNYGFFDSIFVRFAASSANSAGGRIIIWQNLLSSFGKLNIFRLLFGNGFLTAGLLGTGMQAHNTYLSILVGFGIIGLFLFLGYQFNSVINIFTNGFGPYILFAVCLLIYNFSLEPYLLPEGVIFFSLIGALNNIKSKAIYVPNGEKNK